ARAPRRPPARPPDPRALPRARPLRRGEPSAVALEPPARLGDLPPPGELGRWPGAARPRALHRGVAPGRHPARPLLGRASGADAGGGPVPRVGIAPRRLPPGCPAGRPSAGDLGRAPLAAGAPVAGAARPGGPRLLADRRRPPGHLVRD